jgi:hypothetical protein
MNNLLQIAVFLFVGYFMMLSAAGLHRVDKVDDELERIWKEAAVTYSRDYSRICLD